MKSSDLNVILSGLDTVARAFLKINSNKANKFWKNSSLRTVSKALISSTEETLSSLITSEKKNVVSNFAKEVKERSSVVAESIKQYSTFTANEDQFTSKLVFSKDFDIVHPVIQEKETLSSTYKQNSHDDIYQEAAPLDSNIKDGLGNLSKPSLSTEAIAIEKTKTSADTSFKNSSQISIPTTVSHSIPITHRKSTKIHRRQELSVQAREREVPSSRFSRLSSYGVLAVKMGFGAAAEAVRRTLELKTGKDSATQNLQSDNLFLTEANANRIVDTLCKVRGVALKLGQMLSIQDTAMINPELAAVFERVRQSADFMPSWQMEKVLRKELGREWRCLFSEFDPKPFAAASIGQVHSAKLLDSTDIALKIQYPGVAEGIESDIKSIMKIVDIGKILPKGLYLDNIISVAKRELQKEVDYLNEAESGKRFKKLLQSYPQFLIPAVYDDLCTRNVLTTELAYGTPVDKLQDATQELRNEVCKNLLRLCLMEIFLFRFMQTDPNWANFLYNFDTQQIVLLDFGACNEYTPEFVDTYISIIKAAANGDRDNVLHFSQKLGFLTGYETKIMEEAHVEAVMILGEAFTSCKPFNFQLQNMTHRIHRLVPIMLKHRLTPPPMETYSLHRKMSGIFLLCTKLGAIIDCRKLFDDVYEQYCKINT